MKAIKLQRGNKLHHYRLSQYIKAIVLHQREFEFEFWPIRKFHFIQPGPVPSTILNYCPIRWLLFHLPSWILVQSQAELPSWIIVQSEDCFLSAILHFWPIRDELPPLPPWHRTLTFTLLLLKNSNKSLHCPSIVTRPDTWVFLEFVISCQIMAGSCQYWRRRAK